MLERFYTVKEFASLLRVHPSTVRRAIISGRIAAFRVGKGKKAIFRIFTGEIERMAAFDLTTIIEQRAQAMVNENVVKPQSCK